MPKCLGCERVFHKTQLNEAGRCDHCRAAPATTPALDATKLATELDRVIELLDAFYAVAVKIEEKLDVLVQRVQG